MAYSFVLFTGNGSNKNFAFSFPYLDKTHVKVKVDGTVTSAWSWLNDNTVQMTTAPATGAVVEVYRETPQDASVVDFSDGSVLLERDLDLLATFNLYTSQETSDKATRALFVNSVGVFDAGNKRITNVAAPVAAGDAVNKAYADTVINAAAGSASAAAASAAAAAASYDSFDDRYLGPKSSAPSVDNDGNALLVGALYWDTPSKQMFSWSGTTWLPTFVTGNCTRSFVTATAGQTIVSTQTYIQGNNSIQVYLNRAKLNVGADYIETTQNSITLVSPLSAGDELEVLVFQVYPFSDGVTRQELDRRGLLSANQVIAGFNATGLPDGTRVAFAGRDTVGDGLGGYLRFLAGSNIPPNGDLVYAVTGGRLVRDLESAEFSSYTPSGTGTVQRTVQGKLREFVNLVDFGAVGDWNGIAGTDNTAALNAALVVCESSGLPLYIGNGRFYFAGLITKNPSFACPTIYGSGKAFTELVFGNSGVGFKIKGGSGALCGAEIYGVKFSATTSSTTLVQVADQGGLTFRKCGFGKGAIGVELVNESAGGFTEYVVLDECDIDEECVEALVYTRQNGTDSFHGSGLRNCRIQEAATETKSKIRIGGLGSTSNDILVYNAPLSFQIWKGTTLPVLKNNSTRFITNFYGHITMELFGQASSGAVWPFADDARQTYLVGGLSTLQDKTRRGSLVLCDTFETRHDGAVSASLKPFRIEAVNMVSGENTVCTLPAVTTETYLVTVRFADSAGPARKVYLLAVNFDVFGTNTVTTLATLEDFFGGNMPYPTFSMSGYSLVATADFNDTVVCTGTVSKIGLGLDFSL